ncbi:polysaccharide pyruvyl transferase family protein [Microbacterium sp. C5A9]|uniref:hypothetical protein n=1 Tax=Microbacterium sp. C5A9 TaxID=2736663 RepID=UPI001F52160C|nr:hypothetical protein [Microbacterium sp. C5A9]MCI1019191.1 polysaccharide pyruvyl transferase family protein [Microbacterium sp. C5A9]
MTPGTSSLPTPSRRFRSSSLWITGQDDNIGDSLLRRPYARAFAERAPLAVWVREASDDFITGLRLDEHATVDRSWSRWYGRSFAAALRGRALVGINAGEMRVSARGALKLLALLPLLATTRARRGRAVWIGAEVPRTSRRLRGIYRIASRATSPLSWRESESREQMGRGAVTADWAFSEGTTSSEWTPRADRDLLAVVLRGDRDFPAEQWWRWVRQTADQLSLTPTVVVQVRRDSAHAQRAAREYGFDVVEWPEDTVHWDQETVVRAAYSRALVTIGDRLHGLVVAATEGSVPLGWVTSSTGKTGRHFRTVGLDFPSLHEGSSAADLPVVDGDAVDVWRAELRSAVDTARTQITALVASLDA